MQSSHTIIGESEYECGNASEEQTPISVKSLKQTLQSKVLMKMMETHTINQGFTNKLTTSSSTCDSLRTSPSTCDSLNTSPSSCGSLNQNREDLKGSDGSFIFSERCISQQSRKKMCFKARHEGRGSEMVVPAIGHIIKNTEQWNLDRLDFCIKTGGFEGGGGELRAKLLTEE